MDPLSKISRLSSLLRQQLAKQTEQKDRAKTTNRNSPAGDSERSHPEHAASVRTTLIQRIRSIEGDDEQKRRKAVRYFIESLLAAELGEKLTRSPQFHQIVARVQTTMESDPALRADLDQMLRHLVDEGSLDRPS